MTEERSGSDPGAFRPEAAAGGSPKPAAPAAASYSTLGFVAVAAEEMSGSGAGASRPQAAAAVSPRPAAPATVAVAAGYSILGFVVAVAEVDD